MSDQARIAYCPRCRSQHPAASAAAALPRIQARTPAPPTRLERAVDIAWLIALIMVVVMSGTVCVWIVAGA